MELLTNPYSFDSAKLETDSQGRAVVRAKIMKVGKLKYVTPEGKEYFGNITLDTLEKAKKTFSLKPVTIRHPPSLLTPDDIKLYQEGVSADNAQIEEIEGETWLTNDLILQTTQAQKVVEDGKLGVSAGYLRDAIPKTGNNLDFENVDGNHIAIGCLNPRAEGAGVYSLDESDVDGRLLTFATAEPDKELKMAKWKLNAVSVGAFSLDEAQVEYGDDKATEQAIDTLVQREGKLADEIKRLNTSMDEQAKDHEAKLGDLSGQLKALESKNAELEEAQKGMISLDDMESHVEELASVREKANEYKVEAKFSTPFEGKKLVVQAAYPKQSFDDAEVEGAYKTITDNPKMAEEQRKSDAALKNLVSMDSKDQKVPLWALEANVVKRKIQAQNRRA